jgi:hypothetical protein
LPAIGGLEENAESTNISEYVTLQQQPIALSNSFKWQVGLIELMYVNSVYTVSSTQNNMSLLSTVSGRTVKTAVRMAANEYLSPATFLSVFNSTVATAITEANAKTAGTFASGASLVLSYSDLTHKYTLTPTKIGFEILAVDGGDLLKLLGQLTSSASSSASVTDLIVPVQDAYTESLVTTRSSINTPLSTVLNGIINADCIVNALVMCSDGKSVSMPVNLRLNAAAAAGVKTLDGLIGTFDLKFFQVVDAAHALYPTRGIKSTPNTLQFTLLPNNVLQITSVNMGLEVPPTTAEWLLRNFALTDITSAVSVPFSISAEKNRCKSTYQCTARCRCSDYISSNESRKEHVQRCRE